MTSAQEDTHTSDVDDVCRSEPSTCSLDPVDYLPNEILWKIIGFLSVEDLCHLAVCSRTWRNVSNTNSIWLHLCKLRDWERFGTEVDLRKEKPILSITNKHGKCCTTSTRTGPTFQADSVITVDCNLKELAPTCEWKEVYMRAWHLDRNWSKPRYREHCVKFSETTTLASLASDGRTLAGGSESGFTFLWDVYSGRVKKKIPPPEFTDSRGKIQRYRWAHKIVVKNDIGVAAFQGGLVVFEFSTGNVLKTIRGTASNFGDYGPSGLHLEEDKVIVSYTLDRAWHRGEGVPVHIWDISGLVEGEITETKLCTDSLNVSIGEEMKCFACHGHWVITSFKDATAFILWDTRTSQHVRMYRGHSGKVHCGHLHENTIMTGDSIGEIKVWTTESDVCIKTISVNSDKPINTILFNDTGIAAYNTPNVVFLNRDGIILNTQYKFNIASSGKIIRNRIVTNSLSSRGGSICINDVSNGKCLSRKENYYSASPLLHINDTKMIYYGSYCVWITEYW